MPFGHNLSGDLDLVLHNVDSQVEDLDHQLDSHSQGVLDANFPSGSTGAGHCSSSELEPNLSETSPPSTGLTHTPSGIQPGDIGDLWDHDNIHLHDLKITVIDFINALHSATLDDPMTGLSSDALEHVHNPLSKQPSLSVNEDTRLVIDLFMGNPSEITYETNCAAILCCFPGTDLPTYYRTNCLIADLTGIESIVHHMWVNYALHTLAPFWNYRAVPSAQNLGMISFILELVMGKTRFLDKSSIQFRLGHSYRHFTGSQIVLAMHITCARNNLGFLQKYNSLERSMNTVMYFMVLT